VLAGWRCSWVPSFELWMVQAKALNVEAGVNRHPIGPQCCRDHKGPQNVERISAFTHGPHGGTIVTASPSTVFHRDLIISLAARPQAHSLDASRIWSRTLWCFDRGRSITESE
jgi:hypothetical protein